METETNRNLSCAQTYEFSADDDPQIRNNYISVKTYSKTRNVATFQDDIDNDAIFSRVMETKQDTSSASCNYTDSEKSSPAISSTQLTKDAEKTCSSATTGTVQNNVAYIAGPELISRCDRMPKVPMRASMVHSLIRAYGLLERMRQIPATAATEEELCAFHCRDYIQFLKRVGQDDYEKFEDEAQQYGLDYDCPVLDDVYGYGALVAGATLKAAECLVNGDCNVAINWYGGWHHAKKDSASGFCYTNDISLGILKLRERFDKVLYVDLDLHHGDGVEESFYVTNKVFTVSVHKHAVGFFPGTGAVTDVGCGKGRYHSINIPLSDGIRDAEFVALVCRVLKKVHEEFSPTAVVCQCGADGLAGDPMESFNLTPLALGSCIRYMLAWKLPMLLLGGGGYHQANTARCWTYLTAVTLGYRLSNNIPDHKYLMLYGPGYDLSITAGNKKDMNTRESLQTVYRHVMKNLSQINGS